MRYSKEQIFGIFKASSSEDILNKYRLKDLQEMFESVYETKATTSYNKQRIVDTIRNHVHTVERAKCFKY